jgi:hypothetical protein
MAAPLAKAASSSVVRRLVPMIVEGPPTGSAISRQTRAVGSLRAPIAQPQGIDQMDFDPLDGGCVEIIVAQAERIVGKASGQRRRLRGRNIGRNDAPQSENPFSEGKRNCARAKTQGSTAGQLHASSPLTAIPNAGLKHAFCARPT